MSEMKRMGLFEFLGASIVGSAKRAASKISSWAFSSRGHIGAWGSVDPSTGIVITPQTASSLSAVNASVRLLSEVFEAETL